MVRLLPLLSDGTNGFLLSLAICWDEMKLSNEFDTSNRESFRPLYHFTPQYGWMNDPNGMVYKDGVYEGTGKGFRGNIIVSVRIKKSKIVEIKLVKNEEASGY